MFEKIKERVLGNRFVKYVVYGFGLFLLVAIGRELLVAFGVL